jgi:hypothetical protein
MNGDFVECLDCPNLSVTIFAIAVLWMLWTIGALFRIAKHHSRQPILRRVLATLQWTFFVMASLYTAAWVNSHFV